jgi:Crp-like helix-turn-helix domain
VQASLKPIRSHLAPPAYRYFPDFLDHPACPSYCKKFSNVAPATAGRKKTRDIIPKKRGAFHFSYPELPETACSQKYQASQAVPFLKATCPEDTLIYGFDKAGFEGLVLENPTIGLQVIKNLSRRIDWLTSRVGSLSFTNLEDRLYHVLSHAAREHGVQNQGGYAIQFPLTHEDLGFLVGAHRVSINRARKGLRQSGKVIQEGRTLILSAPQFP